MNKEPSYTNPLTELRSVAAVQSARTGLGGAVAAVFFRLLLRMLDSLLALFDAHRAGTLPQPVPRALSQRVPTKSRPRVLTPRIRRRRVAGRNATVAPAMRPCAFGLPPILRPATNAPQRVQFVPIRCI